MKTLLIGLIGLVTFNLSSGQIAVKTQLPGLINLAARTISEDFKAGRVPPYLFLELEIGFGEKNSFLVYGAIRKERYETAPSYWGPNFRDFSGFKTGMAYRRYLGSSDPMEGFYVQPTLQIWQGKVDFSSGDHFGGSERLGGSITVHGGYQLVIGPGFVVDGSLGFGGGTEKLEGTKLVLDRISGYHRLQSDPSVGGIRLVADVRLGIGWMF